MREREVRIPGLTLQRVEWDQLASRSELHPTDFIDIVGNGEQIAKVREHIETDVLGSIDNAYKRRLYELWKLDPSNVGWQDFLKQRMEQNDGVMIWNKLTGEWKRTLREDDYRRVFRSRTQKLFTPNEEAAMRDSPGIFFGMSTNSEVLKTLLQEGMENFIASDPDSIDLSNITRLSDATDDDVGKNKAVFMGSKALEINPYIKFQIYPRRLNHQEMKEIITRGSYVVEMIDDIDEKIVIRDLTQVVADETNRRIPVVMGTNLFDAPLVTVDMMTPSVDGRPSTPIYFQKPELTKEDIDTLKRKIPDDATPEEKTKQFIEKTAKAIKLIGKEFVPERHMVSFILAAKGEMKYWSQRGSDAKLVAVLIEEQVRKFVSGLEMDSKVTLGSRVEYPNGDIKFFSNLREKYPDIFGRFNSLSEATNALYNEIFLPYI